MSQAESTNFSRPLDQLNQNLNRDMARDLSQEITRDLSQNPQDSLAIMRAMSGGGNHDMPSGFPSASDIFSSNPQTNYYDGSSNQPSNYYSDNNSNSQNGNGNFRQPYENQPNYSDQQNYYANDPSRYPPTDSSPQQQSSGSDVLNTVGTVASDVTQAASNNSDSGGGGVWSTVGSIALDCLAFL